MPCQQSSGNSCSSVIQIVIVNIPTDLSVNPNTYVCEPLLSSAKAAPV